MFDNVKSLYIIKNLFDYAPERNKLKIIKYNQSLKDKL